jgi:hypothetical protein
MSPYSLRMILNNDLLDLVRSGETTALAESEQIVQPFQSYVHNPFGEFSIDFLNRYIKDYLLLPKGQSQSLKERLCWWDLVRMSQEGLQTLQA